MNENEIALFQLKKEEESSKQASQNGYCLSWKSSGEVKYIPNGITQEGLNIILNPFAIEQRIVLLKAETLAGRFIGRVGDNK